MLGPLRSLTRSKAPGRLWPVGAGPHYASDATGAYVYGEDGRRLLDMLCSLGAVSLGHRRLQNLSRPRLCSLPHVVEIQAAEAVLAQVAPWATTVRFVKTGSEATSAALLVAQRATGRRVYWRLTGSYHGWHHVWQDDAPDARWFGVGELPAVGADTAAVIVEPPRWEPWSEAWLRAVRTSAHNAGALFLVDSMIYGGRWSLQATTGYTGVVPDLETYGKAYGNGAAIAFVAGGPVLAEHGGAISGTYSGETSGLGALLGVLEAYQDEDVIRWLWARGQQLQDGLRAVCAPYPWAHVEGAPVHQRVRFDDEALGPLFSAQMMQRGILWAPYCANVMRAHTAADIDLVIDAAGESLRVLVGEIQP